jgi:hypothetical protein
MASAFLANLFFIGCFSPTGFEDLIREMKASSLGLEGVSMLSFFNYMSFLGKARRFLISPQKYLNPSLV